MAASGLGTLLVREGLLSEQDRLIIGKTSGNQCWAFAKGVIASGLLDEEELTALLAQRTPFPLLARDFMDRVQAEALSAMEVNLIVELEAFPIELKDEILTVAVADPLDRSTLRQIEFFSGYKVRPHIAPFSQLYQSIQTVYPEFQPRTSDLHSFLTNHASSAFHRQQIKEKKYLLSQQETPKARKAASGASPRVEPVDFTKASKAKAALKPLPGDEEDDFFKEQVVQADDASEDLLSDLDSNDLLSGGETAEAVGSAAEENSGSENLLAGSDDLMASEVEQVGAPPAGGTTETQIEDDLFASEDGVSSLEEDSAQRADNLKGDNADDSLGFSDQDLATAVDDAFAAAGASEGPAADAGEEMPEPLEELAAQDKVTEDLETLANDEGLDELSVDGSENLGDKIPTIAADEDMPDDLSAMVTEEIADDLSAKVGDGMTDDISPIADAGTEDIPIQNAGEETLPADLDPGAELAMEDTEPPAELQDDLTVTEEAAEGENDSLATLLDEDEEEVEVDAAVDETEFNALVDEELPDENPTAFAPPMEPDPEVNYDELAAVEEADLMDDIIPKDKQAEAEFDPSSIAPRGKQKAYDPAVLNQALIKLSLALDGDDAVAITARALSSTLSDGIILEIRNAVAEPKAAWDGRAGRQPRYEGLEKFAGEELLQLAGNLPLNVWQKIPALPKTLAHWGEGEAVMAAAVVGSEEHKLLFIGKCPPANFANSGFLATVMQFFKGLRKKLA